MNHLQQNVLRNYSREMSIWFHLRSIQTRMEKEKTEDKYVAVIYNGMIHGPVHKREHQYCGILW